MFSRILVIATFLFSASAFAEQKSYELKINVAVNGKTISTPTMVVKEGVPASMTNEKNGEGNFVEVVAREGKDPKGRDAIIMEMVVGTISKGTKTILSKPTLMGSVNKKVEMTSGGNGQKETVYVSAIANPIVMKK